MRKLVGYSVVALILALVAINANAMGGHDHNKSCGNMAQGRQCAKMMAANDGQGMAGCGNCMMQTARSDQQQGDRAGQAGMNCGNCPKRKACMNGGQASDAATNGVDSYTGGSGDAP